MDKTKTKKMILTEVLKRVLKCPCHKELMSFEVLHGMRIVRNGFYNAKCEKSGKYFKVKK